MPALAVDPDTGEVLDTRDVPRVIRALLSPEGHPQVRCVLELGALKLPSGAVSIADPNHLHKQPLVRRVPRRQHPVTLLCGDDPSEAGAVVIRFGAGEVAVIEPAQGIFPYDHSNRLPLRGTVGAIFDSGTATNLRDPERVAALLVLAEDRPGAMITVPGLRRAWNVALFRPALAGETFYSMWWALDGEGSPLALIVDFALFE